MNIGTIKEIKSHEYRVGLTPACVEAYCSRGHDVFVEAGAGINAGFGDGEYQKAGALVWQDKEKIFGVCEMIVKVKEPLDDECELLREGQILYTYLHLAASRELTEKLLARKVKAVAYETIETDDGELPCLKPMSQIAGRLAVQEGAKYLEKPFGGRGILLGGVPGIARGKVAILGGGVAGTNACKIAVGIGANVTVLDTNSKRLAYLDDVFGSSITTLYCTDANINVIAAESDLIIGAVLIPGSKAPHLIQRKHLGMMKKGAVLVDISVDQGGCFETSRPTTHDDPVFVVDGIVHYCVTNMPGAVGRTSAIALNNATLPYALTLADVGYREAAAQDPGIAAGINMAHGKVTNRAVAETFNMEYAPLEL